MVDKVEIKTGDEIPSAGTTDHLEEMLQVADTADNPEVHDRPDWLPTKFDSPEDLAQAYNELEQRMGSQGLQQEQPQNEEWVDKAQYTEQVEEDPSEVREFLASKNLDFDSFQDEYNQTGQLSDNAYEALEKSGIPPTLVDSWLEGQRAVSEQVQQSVHNAVGGTEAYNQMVEWASENWDQQDIDAFNQSVDSANTNQVMLAVRGLHAQYNLANSNPSLYSGDGGSVSPNSFESLNQITEAMKDPRYSNDPSYRREVESMLQNSNVI